MKQAYSVVDDETGGTVLESVAYASSPIALAVGLIASRDTCVSLWLPYTSMVHTLGMRYPLDVLFLSGEGVVLRVDLDVHPGRLLVGPETDAGRFGNEIVRAVGICCYETGQPSQAGPIRPALSWNPFTLGAVMIVSYPLAV